MIGCEVHHYWANCPSILSSDNSKHLKPWSLTSADSTFSSQCWELTVWCMMWALHAGHPCAASAPIPRDRRTDLQEVGTLQAQYHPRLLPFSMTITKSRRCTGMLWNHHHWWSFRLDRLQFSRWCLLIYTAGPALGWKMSKAMSSLIVPMNLRFCYPSIGLTFPPPYSSKRTSCLLKNSQMCKEVSAAFPSQQSNWFWPLVHWPLHFFRKRK